MTDAAMTLRAGTPDEGAPVLGRTAGPSVPADEPSGEGIQCQPSPDGHTPEAAP